MGFILNIASATALPGPAACPMNDLPTFTVQLSDEAFDPAETRHYGLGLVVGAAEFSCAVLDFRKNKFLGLHHGYAEKTTDGRLTRGDPPPEPVLLSAVRALPWLAAPFRMVRIAFDGKPVTLVPSQLYDADAKQDHHRFVFGDTPEEVVQSDHLMPLDAWQVYSVPRTVRETVREIFPQQKVVHVAGLFIETIWINYKNRIHTPHVFLHLRGLHFDLMIFDGRTMSFFNTFTYETPEDVVYYLIFVMEQLGLNPDSVPLVLTGPVEPGDPLWNLLARYLRHVTTCRRNEAYHYGSGFDGLPGHHFVPLLNFFSCGL